MHLNTHTHTHTHNKLSPAASWPEYAVKIVSTSTLKSMGYEARVRREVAALTVLTHPCIARLISAFRWKDGAYLVLEYASRGDLHSLLSKLGSLGEEPARFLMAEALSALMHIHDKVFVENTKYGSALQQILFVL